MELCTYQWNELVKCIIQAGFNPSNFKRGENNDNLAKNFNIEYLNESSYSASGIEQNYWFQIIYCLDEYQFKFRCKPSRTGPASYGSPVSDWNQIILEFMNWLKLLQREIDEVDLWTLYETDRDRAFEETRKYLALVIPPELDHPLSSAERDEFFAKFQSIQQDTEKALNGNNSALQKIASAVELIAQSSKKRPRSVVFSAIEYFSLLFGTELSKECSREILSRLKELALTLIN